MGFPGHVVVPYLQACLDALFQNASMAAAFSWMARVAPPDQVGLSMDYLWTVPQVANAAIPVLGGYLVVMNWKSCVWFTIIWWIVSGLIPLIMPKDTSKEPKEPESVPSNA